MTSVAASSSQSVTPANLFSAAVRSVFENWEAFKIGTSMGKQSRDMVEMVISATEQCLHDNRDLDSGQELGEWIGETLDINFNLRVEDGSLDDAGAQLVNYWKLYQNQEYDKIRVTLENISSTRNSITLMPKVEGLESSEDEDVDDEKMDMDPPTELSSLEQGFGTTNSVDADGWTTVRGKKKM